MQIRVVRQPDPDLPVSWDAVLAGQLHRQDPTADWRAQVAAAAIRSSGAPVEPSMPAAFVLQWVLEVAAEVGVEVALHHGVVDPHGAGLRRGRPTGPPGRSSPSRTTPGSTSAGTSAWTWSTTCGR